MSGLPLFYSSVAVLDRDKNRDLHVVDGARSARFAEKAHLIPAVADEFFSACRELPIVFVMSDGKPTPVFVVGVEPGRNALIDTNGKWITRHIPAYVRRYPFILGDVEGAGSLVCIDGGYEAPTEGGEALFVDAANSPYLNSAIHFVNNFAEASRRTDAFVKLLTEHDLLQGITVDVKTQAGPNAVLHGFLSIDEAKLAALSDEAFLSLRKDGALAFIYSQLLSLGAFSKIGDAISEHTPASAAA